MKRILLNITLFSLLLAACTKLDVKVESQYTSNNFPTTPADFTAVIGAIYSQLSSKYAINYFRMQELTTDECILPARDGNYDDGGQYRQHHNHTYTADHPNVKDVWEWGFGGINLCNRILNTINASSSATDAKNSAVAEVKTMRALFYFFMMDIYGNVPVIDSFPVVDQPVKKTRVEVFNFIEKEVKASLPYLPAKSITNAAATYGHPTKGMAYALLAKMYINSEVYTGMPRYQETVAMCDSVIGSNLYSLESNFNDIYAPNNGPQIKEAIFAIPYDALLIPGQQFTRHAIMAYLYVKYNVPNHLSVSMSTTPQFYARFNLAGDVRNDTWLIGKQYNFDGTPYYLPAMKKKDLDASYTGLNTDTIWQLEITKDIIMTGKKPFDVGNDFKARCMGVRSIKYYPDPATTAATRNSGNDMYVFRLADIYLMKAEAIVRGATPTIVKGELQTPLALLNKIRTRAKAPLATDASLSTLLDERGREFYYENWRRNDLIRFGKYEVEYPIPGDVAVPGYKPGMDKSTYRRIFPIPSSELKLNPKLIQNEGY